MSNFKSFVVSTSGKVATSDGYAHSVLDLDVYSLVLPFANEAGVPAAYTNLVALCEVDLVASDDLDGYGNVSRIAFGIKSPSVGVLDFVDDSTPSTVLLITDMGASTWMSDLLLNTPGGGLHDTISIQVVGEDGKTVNWIANAKLTVNMSY